MTRSWSDHLLLHNHPFHELPEYINTTGECSRVNPVNRIDYGIVPLLLVRKVPGKQIVIR